MARIPERLVVNVMGDTAFGIVGMDTKTAVRERIGVLPEHRFLQHGYVPK
jgi:hypothetical protein